MLLHERFPNTIQFPLVFGWVGGCLGAHLLILTFVKNTMARSQIDGGVEFWCSAGLLLDCSLAFSGKKTQCSLGLLCQFWIDVDQCNLKVVERWFEFKFIQMILNRWKFVSCTPSYSVDLFWILFFSGVVCELPRMCPFPVLRFIWLRPGLKTTDSGARNI